MLAPDCYLHDAMYTHYIEQVLAMTLGFQVTQSLMAFMKVHHSQMYKQYINHARFSHNTQMRIITIPSMHLANRTRILHVQCQAMVLVETWC